MSSLRCIMSKLLLLRVRVLFLMSTLLPLRLFLTSRLLLTACVPVLRLPECPLGVVIGYCTNVLITNRCLWQGTNQVNAYLMPRLLLLKFYIGYLSSTLFLAYCCTKLGFNVYRMQHSMCLLKRRFRPLALFATLNVHREGSVQPQGVDHKCAVYTMEITSFEKGVCLSAQMRSVWIYKANALIKGEAHENRPLALSKTP